MELANYLRAVDYAIRKHGSAMRKDGDRLYVVHPIQVAEILRANGIDDTTTLCAAILHDVLEDTTAKYDDLAKRFGSEVADLVVEVTHDTRMPRQARREHLEQHAGDLSDAGKAIKLADRIANLGDLAATPPKGWSDERIEEYRAHSRRLFSALEGTHPRLDAEFRTICGEAPA